MQLTFLLALVLAFVSLLGADGHPVDSADVQLVGSALACGTFLGLAWWTGQLRRHAGSEPTGLVAHCLRRGEQALGPAYLGAVGLAFVWFDFAEIVHSNWRLSRIVWGDDGVIVMALVMPLCGAWLLDPWTWPDAGVASHVRGARSVRMVLRRARQTLLLPLVPVLLIAGIADLERLLVPEVGSKGFAVVPLAVLVVIAATLPEWLRVCWPTSRLKPGPQRAIIQQILKDSQVRVREILRWETDGRLANAAMSGFLPSLRYLFVSDELLRCMTADQLRAITAHEAAHARHGHLARLGMSLMIPLAGLSLADPVLVEAAGMPLAVLAVLGVWAIAHGVWARLLEHHADVAACRLLSGGKMLAPAAIAALGGALEAAGAGRGDWLHPSSSARVALLERLCSCPEAADAFERRVQWAFRLQELLLMALLVAWLGRL
jgi:Zn-dependent protease with chaperone function